MSGFGPPRSQGAANRCGHWMKSEGCARRVSATLSPAPNADALESSEIHVVERHENQFVNPGDRRNLAVDKGWRLSRSRKTCPLHGVPLCGCSIVVEDRHRRQNDFFEIALDRNASARGRKSFHAKWQTLPDDRR